MPNRGPSAIRQIGRSAYARDTVAPTAPVTAARVPDLGGRRADVAAPPRRGIMGGHAPPAPTARDPVAAPTRDPVMRLTRIVGAVGQVLITLGVLLLLFVAYQLWGTGLHE